MDLGDTGDAVPRSLGVIALSQKHDEEGGDGHDGPDTHVAGPRRCSGCLPASVHVSEFGQALVDQFLIVPAHRRGRGG